MNLQKEKKKLNACHLTGYHWNRYFMKIRNDDQMFYEPN